jgi:hypothetical protein
LRDILAIVSNLKGSTKLSSVANQLGGSGGYRNTLWIADLNAQFTAFVLRMHAHGHQNNG